MTLPRSYFDSLYSDDADPWSLATRWYERRKYAITVASLDRSRYRRCFEAGSSVGVLSAMLSGRCDELVSADISAPAVRATRERLDSAGHPDCRFTVEQRALPEQWPPGSFDLIVLSEMLYYFASTELDAVLDRAVASLEPGGTLLAVHWRHPVTDYPLGGDDVHQRIRRRAGLTLLGEHREADFALDVLVRAEGETASPVAASSVAARENLG